MNTILLLILGEKEYDMYDKRKTLSHLPSADNRLLCQSPPINLSGLIRILFLF